jgi:hypothetical protein
VTHAGVADLRKSLPECSISRVSTPGT